MQHRIIVWVVFKPSRVAQWHPLPSIWQLFEGPVNSFFSFNYINVTYVFLHRFPPIPSTPTELQLVPWFAKAKLANGQVFTIYRDGAQVMDFHAPHQSSRKPVRSAWPGWEGKELDGRFGGFQLG